MAKQSGPKWVFWSTYKGHMIFKLERPHEGAEPPVGWPDYVVLAPDMDLPPPGAENQTMTLSDAYDKSEEMLRAEIEAEQPEPTPRGTVGVAKAAGEAPGPTMQQPDVSAPAGLIPGVPNLYLYAGAAALGMLMLGMIMKKRKG